MARKQKKPPALGVQKFEKSPGIIGLKENLLKIAKTMLGVFNITMYSSEFSLENNFYNKQSVTYVFHDVN